MNKTFKENINKRNHQHSVAHHQAPPTPKLKTKKSGCILNYLKMVYLL